MPEPVLEIDGVSKHFALRRAPLAALAGKPRRRVQAVADVEFAIGTRECFGLVGESGCGKSTLARLALGLLRPDAGHIRFQGEDIGALSGHGLRALRRGAQMVFQDPYASLNPRMTVGAAIAEPLAWHKVVPPADVKAETRRLLSEVGLGPETASRYPRELSGGQRQRVGIARSLAVRPALLVADEAVSALDVSVRAQVLNLLADLGERRGLSMLFISHDLGVIAYLCARVGVMYLGHLVESGPVAEVFRAPAHPYTRALIGAIPKPDPAAPHPARPLEGEPPSAAAVPEGCPFRTRCPSARSICMTMPPRIDFGAGHWAACHFATEIRNQGAI
ncbi:MAG TPA: oligopeptide/dipeptide ABC transporter ATP-binding protein [Acetobacteraceae bacterium]|nr:oligopeptide/dipeptide ABC transporter ATP-binding protein [Acetobacteraceae bacterium]